MRILMREGAEGRWKPVSASGYEDEAALRDLVFDSPSVIPLEEVRPGVPPLVAAIREFGLPGSGSTDVLAFNVEGDIAVVECKLATNDEIKRDVRLDPRFLSLCGGNREKQSQTKKSRAHYFHRTSSKNGEEKAAPAAGEG